MTKIEIGAKLIKETMEELSGNILIVTDSWFGNKSLARKIGFEIMNKFNILTRLRIDSILYSNNVEHTGRRGRKSKYGKKLPKLVELAKTLERKRDIFNVYGKERKVEYSEFTAMHKGFMRQVKIILVYSKNRHVFPIFTTDLSLSVKDIVEYYSARWKIESGFKELKHELGAIDNQARKINSVENHFSLCLIAQTSVWLYALKQTKAPSRKYASAKSNIFTFGDVRRKIAFEFHEDPIFKVTCSKAIKSIEKILLLLFLCRAT